MNLLDTLKQLKNIQADSSYAEKSRRMILASARQESVSAPRIFVRMLEAAGSLALAGLLIFAIAGGFSSSRYLSPVSFQGIDPVALHAEAQAIDMQINIANLNYEETSNEGASTPMAAVSARVKTVALTPTSSVVAPAPVSTATSTATSTPSSASSSATSTTLSINEALQQLEQ